MESSSPTEILTINELRAAASSNLQKDVEEYYNEGAGDMVTMSENETAFDRFKIRPRILCDVSNIDTSTTFLGEKANYIFPSCLAHPDGEAATSRAATQLNIPMVLSTFSTVSLEDVISERKEGQNPYAFQPIFPRDRSRTLDWMKRAEKSGYKAIFITVDAPVTANRLRKKRKSLQLPPHLSYPNLSDNSDRSSDKSGHDPGKRWDEVIPWVKANTSLEVWVKGISCPYDVLKAIDYGLDGLVISSHGGRQLDGVAAAIDVLAECAPLAKGRIKIGFDSGIRRGADVFRALALGADICFLGRIPLWGLAYDGQAGVELAVRILEEELRNTMAHAGCASLKEISRTHVSVIGANGLLCNV
ncbi:(S)-2-hydroxy-acid oxidase [Aspergillus flavus]|uniref:(S)-2-hydroxy-acid oxidase n=1 Tax=Aspergillus flavus TaxID=5059 RepID=A0AB74BX12_ASPFL|nr:(S)-2-hydroxy-acid oxidase [Aspergillus flavus]RAQ81586.1 (S)-2-hydroxy-acid oxidase [Aspergillus flavus]RMZ38900.1 (S)-2-hydroxy-acid oxidase [Aspergillus flavus]